MLVLYYLFLKNPLMLLISYIIQVVPYYFVLKKMGCNQKFAILPNLAEYAFTRKLFPKKRTFFRPFIVACIFLGFAYYLDPFKNIGLLYTIIAFIIYSIFLIRLYSKMGKAFGKNWSFIAGIILLPPVFLSILGLGKAEFKQPAFKPEKQSPFFWKLTKKVAFMTISIVEVAALFIMAGYLSIRQRMPRMLVESLHEDIYDQTHAVTNTGDVVTREDILGSQTEIIMDDNRSRDYFFADHSKDKDVVVFVYVVGADLEDMIGYASINITQMIDASKQGTGLKFVLEAGGSSRWFTKGIKDGSYGRYEIYDGKLTKIADLPAATNMASGEELTDFLKWGNDNYHPDRTMLVLWDHGGGFQNGYAVDEINGESPISVSDMVSALADSHSRFDLIGFDACLMQDIEVAKVFEPYADYFLASEETESGLGWPYTFAFGSLAKTPNMSTVDFGRQLISCFDIYNNSTFEGPIDTSSTLSLVDLTMVDSAYKKLDQIFARAADVILEDTQAFADVSIACQNTYDFQQMQLDLIDFLQILDELDYNNAICSHEQKEDAIQALSSAIVCRNANSAHGINGMAFALPYNTIENYDYTSDGLKTLSFTNEKKLFDEVFSIMAAQQHKADEEQKDEIDTSDFMSIISYFSEPTDYTAKEWYIEGFENYDDTPRFIDIPLLEGKDGYEVDLPEKTWNIITDVQTMVYQKVDGGYIRYIGNDYLGALDENGHTTISADENWVHMNGQLVCYEADQVKSTDDGDIYTGRIRARLNNDEDITIVIEWDAVEEGAPEQAHVLGYLRDKEEGELENKGYNQFVAGDAIQFLFDYYDSEGNYVETKTDGKKIRITKQKRLNVTDEKMKPCTLQFGGLLKDIYQRLMTTEMIEYTIE